MKINVLGTEYKVIVKKYDEMVDWIALQGPKIYKVWQEAGAL